ncbi:universal stress protein [Haloarchaeobius sp. HRN-SO-5]|uniref:universal stress protein n=1 Tax=Haloarchaeobius sp. HRN-SO-5 TaxID=3446118 RepID=UPI003EB8C27F
MAFEHLLVPVDGSPESEAAVERAVRIAEQDDAALTFLHVVDTAVLGLDARVEAIIDNLEAEAQRLLEEAVEEAHAVGIEPVDRRIESGSPAETILDVADETGADLVVVGSHGRTGLDRFLLGSVSERVVRRAPVSVLVVRE